MQLTKSEKPAKDEPHFKECEDDQQLRIVKEQELKRKEEQLKMEAENKEAERI